MNLKELCTKWPWPTAKVT